MTLKEAAAHKAEPNTPHWWTASQNGAWRSGCKHCERTIEWTNGGYWRHAK